MCGCALPRWRVCSTEKTVALSNGLKIDAAILPKRPRSDRSIWLVPGLGLTDADAVLGRFSEPDAAQAIRALRAQAKAGGTIAASCSAVFLLHAAGLLTDKRVTTTWWLGGLLQRMEPRCVVDVDQMVVSDGNIVTGGAAFAHIDLVLHLLRTRFSPSLADAVSRAMVIDGRQSQAQYIVPTTLANGNELATKLVACFEAGVTKSDLAWRSSLQNSVCPAARSPAALRNRPDVVFPPCSRACASIARACFWRPARCPSSRWPSRLAMPIPPRCGALCGRLRKRHQDSSGRWCLTTGEVRHRPSRLSTRRRPCVAGSPPRILSPTG